MKEEYVEWKFPSLEEVKGMSFDELSMEIQTAEYHISVLEEGLEEKDLG